MCRQQRYGTPAVDACFRAWGSEARCLLRVLRGNNHIVDDAMTQCVVAMAAATVPPFIPPSRTSLDCLLLRRFPVPWDCVACRLNGILGYRAEYSVDDLDPMDAMTHPCKPYVRHPSPPTWLYIWLGPARCCSLTAFCLALAPPPCSGWERWLGLVIEGMSRVV